MVYVATGAGGPDFGLVPDPGGAFASTRPGCFLGGSLAGRTTMEALADGLKASHALERYLKVGSMNHPADRITTQLKLDPSRIPAVDAVVPADGRAYTQEEAVREAKRCLLCACDACFRACDLMHYFRKFPKRIAEEIHLSVHPGTLDGNGTLATRLMSTCNQCGLCKEVCPEGIDTGDIFLQGHRAMHAQGAMPWAWHEAFKQDMAFAVDEAGLSRMPAGFGKSRYLFFPGCQLGGSDPRYVTESYRFLREHWPDTALTLGCCGAPAEWAGDEEARAGVMDRISEDWKAFGQPTFVFACPTCRLMFKRHLPEIQGVFPLRPAPRARGLPGAARARRGLRLRPLRRPRRAGPPADHPRPGGKGRLRSGPPAHGGAPRPVLAAGAARWPWRTRPTPSTWSRPGSRKGRTPTSPTAATAATSSPGRGSPPGTSWTCSWT